MIFISVYNNSIGDCVYTEKYNLSPAVLKAILRYPNDVEKQVLSIFAYHGFSKPRKHMRHIRTGAKLCIQAYLKYKSYYKAGKVLGVSPSLVYYHVKKYYNKLSPTPHLYYSTGWIGGHEDESGVVSDDFHTFGGG